jgi:uncharacterized membrane protein
VHGQVERSQLTPVRADATSPNVGYERIDMGLLTILRVVAVVSAGLLAGIFLGHRAGLHYALSELNPSSFVRLGQTMYAHNARFMPSLVFTAPASSVLWLVMVGSQWRTAEFWLVATSACGIVAIVAVSRAVNLPLNQQLMTWSVASPPPNPQQLWAPWERINTLRSVLATGALVLETVALSVKAVTAR